MLIKNGDEVNPFMLIFTLTEKGNIRDFSSEAWKVKMFSPRMRKL